MTMTMPSVHPPTADPGGAPKPMGAASGGTNMNATSAAAASSSPTQAPPAPAPLQQQQQQLPDSRLDGVPVDYLETFPLPVFVLRVRSEVESPIVMARELEPGPTVAERDPPASALFSSPRRSPDALQEDGRISPPTAAASASSPAPPLAGHNRRSSEEEGRQNQLPPPLKPPPHPHQPSLASKLPSRRPPNLRSISELTLRTQRTPSPRSPQEPSQLVSAMTDLRLDATETPSMPGRNRIPNGSADTSGRNPPTTTPPFSPPTLHLPLLGRISNHDRSERAASKRLSLSSDSYVHVAAIAPLSAPLSEQPRLEWANCHAREILSGRQLESVLDGHTLATLQEWAENHNNVKVFTLKLHKPAITIDLVKAYQPRKLARQTILVVLTAVNVDRYSPTPHPTGETSPRTVEPEAVGDGLAAALPALKNRHRLESTARVGPVGLSVVPVEENKDQYSIILPFRRRTRSSLMFANKEQKIVKQCHLLLDEINWTATTLGPRTSWPPEITSMILMAFSSFTQDCVFAGEELLMIYNQNYSVLVDHPNAFGLPMATVWAPLWSDLKPLMSRAWGGEPVHHENDVVFHQRNDRGRFVERYHTYSLIPIVSYKGDTGDNKVVGIYNTSLETTGRVLAERRLETMRELVAQVSLARSSGEFYEAIADVLEGNSADAPFVICYSVHDRKVASTETTEGVELRLESTVGVPRDHGCAPPRLRTVIPKFHSVPTMASTSVDSSSSSNLDGARRSVPMPMLMQTREEAQMWPIARALASRQCVVVDNCADLIKGFPIRQWDELPDMAIVIPLSRESSPQTPRGVVILGLNLFRPLDLEYEDWIQVTRNHLSSALGSVIAYEEEVQRQVDKDKLERAKTAWFRGAAHEFRSPLTLIEAPLEDLDATDLTSTQRQSLELARTNAQRLSNLVNSLLDFTRLEAGQVQARFMPTRLGAFTSELGAMFRPATEQLKIGFIIDVEEHTAPVSVDPALIEMVVSNLLLIGIKFTKQGSVLLRVWYEDDHANIAVTDAGSGIPAAEIDMVTECFHRVDTGADRTSEGTGIGLALVREIVHLHLGELLIESKRAGESGDGQHGSTFTARIPTNLPVHAESVAPVPFGAYTRQLAREVRSWTGDDAGGSPKTMASAAGPGSTLEPAVGRRLARGDGFADGLMFERSDVLLIVDDSADIRAYIKYVFEPYVTVVEAASGVEALELVKNGKLPHLVLCDLFVAHMSGLELLRALRAENGPTRLVPFVMLSAAIDDETRVDALLAGADDFLPKPFQSKELLLRVHLHMQMGKKRVQLETLFTNRELELAVLSDYCPSGIARADEHGWLTYTNEAFREPAGMGPNENPNLWVDYCDTETWIRLEPIWQEIIYGERTITNLKWKWLTGRTMSGVFIRLDKVRPGLKGILACVTDISYQEEKLHEAERRQREAEESKHQQELLVDLISHEIRNPVSAILQCSSLVRENLVGLKEQLRVAGDGGFKPTPKLLDDLEEDVGALDSIVQCGLVQERIAGDVLSLARIQLDLLSLHNVEMDLRGEARKVLSVFASEARMKKIEIQLNFGDSLARLAISSIKTDPVRLGQVITNLISNAIRFTAASDVRRITVQYDVAWDPPNPSSYTLPPLPLSPPSTPVAEDTPIYLYVSVRDTGPGMTQSETKVLFKRFSQGNKMIHTQYGGTGLGLFIGRKITELLGGGIEVQSEVGKGTVFRFFIKAATVSPSPQLGDMDLPPTTYAVAPLASPSASPSAPAFREGFVAPASPASPTQPVVSHMPVSPLVAPAGPLAADEDPSRPMHVLIVEDNLINQTVLRRQMVKAGLTADVASNGQEGLTAIYEAIQHAREGTAPAYDVVLMDLEMPVMDGLTAVKLLREAEAEADEERPQLVIALTGNARQGQIDQAISMGMDDVVIKPYRLPDLIAKMRSAVAARCAECP